MLGDPKKRKSFLIDKNLQEKIKISFLIKISEDEDHHHKKYVSVATLQLEISRKRMFQQRLHLLFTCPTIKIVPFVKDSLPYQRGLELSKGSQLGDQNRALICGTSQIATL